MYAKLISKTEISFPPKNKDNILNYNLNIDLLIADGYKEFIEVERPITNRFYHIEYQENETNITEVIVYDETQMEADERELKTAKEAKYNEALSKAYDYEENGTVEHKNCVFEMSLKNRDNLRDTVEALTTTGQTETTWNDKNDNLVILTLEDIQYIRLNLILGRIQKLWITQYPEYLTAIEEATTVEEVEAIEIDYTKIKEE